MFYIFRAEVRRCGVHIVKRSNYEEEKSEKLKLRKTMSWWWLLSSPLLLHMIAAQQRVFLKPEEPGEV